MSRDVVVVPTRYLAWSLAVQVARACIKAARQPDLEATAELQDARANLDKLEVLVTVLQRERRCSWADLAEMLGVERQSLHRRLSRKVDQAIADMHSNVRNAGYLKVLRHGVIENLKALRSDVADMQEVTQKSRFLEEHT